jgi:hypothetical protein
VSRPRLWRVSRRRLRPQRSEDVDTAGGRPGPRKSRRHWSMSGRSMILLPHARLAIHESRHRLTRVGADTIERGPRAWRGRWDQARRPHCRPPTQTAGPAPLGFLSVPFASAWRDRGVIVEPEQAPRSLHPLPSMNGSASMPRASADVMSAGPLAHGSDLTAAAVTDHPVGSSRQAAQVAKCRPRRTVA